MSYYSSGYLGRPSMYPGPYPPKHEWGGSRRVEAERYAFGFQGNSRFPHHPPLHPQSGFANVVPDGRLSHATPHPFHPRASLWPDDRPIHTPEWRSRRNLPPDMIERDRIPPSHFRSFSTGRPPMFGHPEMRPQHIRAHSYDIPVSQQHYEFDEEDYQPSPPPPYAPDSGIPTQRPAYPTRQIAQTARSRHEPHASPSQMQMVRYDPATVHNRDAVQSSGYTERAALPFGTPGPDRYTSSNWSHAAQYGSPNPPHQYPRPYQSEYTRFSTHTAPYNAQQFNMDRFREYRENEVCYDDEDDSDMMSDGVASDEVDYYSSDGGHLGEFDEDEIFSDDGYSSPIDDDDFYEGG